MNKGEVCNVLEELCAVMIEKNYKNGYVRAKDKYVKALERALYMLELEEQEHE